MINMKSNRWSVFVQVTTVAFLFLSFLDAHGQIDQDSAATDYRALPNDIEWTDLLSGFTETKLSIDDGYYKDIQSADWIYFFQVNDGVINGELVCKDSNGVFRQITNYVDGVRNGISRNFIDGKLSVIKYFDWGTTFEEIFYYPNGVVKKRYLMIKYVNYVSEYHENGFLKSFGAVSPMGKVGFWVFRSNNGMKTSEGTFKDRKKEGVWDYFDDKGGNTYSEKYVEGVLLETYEHKW